jgi:hypothetical protein
LYGQSKACQLCHSPRDDVAPTTSTRRPAGRLPAPSVRRRGAPTGARETSLRLPPTVTRKTNNFLRRLRICSIFVLNAARPERDRRVVRVRRRPSAQRRPSDRSGRAAHAAEAGRSQASRRSLERGVSVGETVAREGETRRPEMAPQPFEKSGFAPGNGMIGVNLWSWRSADPGQEAAPHFIST